MKLDQLSYFVEAARREHLGKAAKALAVSPSAISHSIAALEEEFGQALFAREGKRVVLTSHGRLLAQSAAQVLDQVARLKDEMTAANVELRGRYRLGATHSLAVDCLAKAWVELYQLHPRVSGEIASLRSAQVVQQVAAGEIDLGLCYNPRSHANIAKETLCTGHMVICTRRDHPLLALPEDDRLDLLLDFPVAAPRVLPGIETPAGSLFDDAVAIRGEIDLVYDSYDVAALFLERTDAWTVLPDWVHRDRVSCLAQLVPARPGEEYEIAVIWPKSRPPARALRELIAVLGKRF
jgi:DNA-binding transcriptional LysR family regulator